MSNQQMAGFEVQCVPQTKAYAQKAIFEVMRSGGWYTVRQLMEKARVSDPRGNIRTLDRWKSETDFGCFRDRWIL